MPQVEVKGLDKLQYALDHAIMWFDRLADEGIHEIAEKLGFNMRQRVRVKTGALRDSITVKKQYTLIIAIIMLYYGFYLEYGTSKMPAYPFIRPSTEALRSETTGIMWKHLKTLFKG